jgi:hypothetical protein
MEWLPGVQISGHFGPVMDVVWGRAGNYVVSCSTDQTTRVWAKLAPTEASGYGSTASGHTACSTRAPMVIVVLLPWSGFPLEAWITLSLAQPALESRGTRSLEHRYCARIAHAHAHGRE